MFKFTKLSLVVAIAASTVLFSCKKDDKKDNPTPGPNNPVPKPGSGLVTQETKIGDDTYTIVAGSVDKGKDFTFTAAGKWIISGGLFVQDGATLTIEPGATVYASDDKATAFIAIQKGGKIMAEGTADKPITLTTIKEVKGGAVAGDWGGLIINGKAKINLAGGTATGEGNTGEYGGNDDADNSGSIKYVVLKYAGKILGDDNELNGFSFNGVGSGTTVEYVQAYMCKDDGFEFFGGTVNMKYAISTGSDDDSFDWTYGYRGKGQFWVAECSADSDRGIEGDGSSKDNNATPASHPILSNVTLIGKADEHTGMRLREGTEGEFFNFIVTGFTDGGVKVTNNDTAGPDDKKGTADDLPENKATEENVADGTLKMSNSTVFGIKDDKNFTSKATPWDGNNDNVSTAVTFTNGFVGALTTGAKQATEIDSWFTATDFIGAVKDEASDWTKGWSLNLDGSKR